ncbi:MULTISPECIES: ATP-dependent nuclease [unclassified Bradyrhizobium]|uniref:ATP-dependent nuclease n=1 Tax=unclassified Bradyrhizobium TaxID=2631580 RepID=UPI0028E700C0|nr:MULTISPECIES: AAA family ATPase [unclassified Bradyrhizobium]
MKIESVLIKNFRCFGPDARRIALEQSVTVFVGNNGSGKTAAFQALSRLFGVTTGQRLVRRQDFHIGADQQELPSGTTLSVECVLAFPELEDAEPDDLGAAAVPEFFLQMAASAPGDPLKVRVRLQATWTDDGTPDGSVDEDIRWITTLDDKFEWDACKRVQAGERGAIQLIYVPAARDAATQVTALLKGRLWQAAKWSGEFRTNTASSAQTIQTAFESEKPLRFVIERLKKRWTQVHEADTDTTPALRLVEDRFEELVRKAEFAFYPDEAGRERSLNDLSDGQRSLFHIALTAATLEVERDAFALSARKSPFDQEKLRRACLTLLVIEEPENSLSPFFLSRIVAQARDIGALDAAQVFLSSHSPAILSRIDPAEVRYFQLLSRRRRTVVRQLTLPTEDEDASRYVRLAVRAHPELYFARFVILCEGDSERIVIPRVAEAMGVPLDPSFVAIVPLGGRYVGHFWQLLSDLRIPHATLLDLDLGRVHGGANVIRSAIEQLKEIEPFFPEIDQDSLDALDDADLFEDFESNEWVKLLRENDVYFSYPLDLDFAMLRRFSEYEIVHPGGRGPLRSEEAIARKKVVTLKTGGNPELYVDIYDDEFIWYPYLFLNRSKPETHLAALSRIDPEELADDAPPEITALIKHVKERLGLADGAGE